MSRVLRQRKAAVRLPWALTAAALTAFAALAVTGGVTPVLPLLALALLATYKTDARIEPPDWWVHWALRLALYAVIGFLNANKANENLVDAFLLATAADTLGQCMAAELVIQAWRRQPAGGPRVGSAIICSGLTLVAACQTSDEQYPRLFVPLYMFFLLTSLIRAERGAAALRWTALAVALGAGATTYAAVWTDRAPLTAWGTQYLEGRAAPEGSGLSAEPTLGETFGLRGSPRRVLRVTGLNGITYLRGVSFDTYNQGHWGPGVERRDYGRFPPQYNPGGALAEVTPLSPTDGLLLAPLNCSGLEPGDNDDVQWSGEAGGPIRVRPSQPAPYEIRQSLDETHQGPLAVPLSRDERVRCLVVPPDVAPGIRALARQIAGGLHDPREQIQAVERYLIAHHRYSLTIHPGPGDPVSSFLLRQPPQGAHCEYFAASATLLLRCLGLPARYVVGYYAHERDGHDLTVVRQRDAHAWTEAWVTGTGWVTVDATPGDGRPSGDNTSLPWWQRAAEWLADSAVAARAWLLGLNWPYVSLCVGGSAVLALLVRAAWLGLHRASGPGDAAPGYTAPSADLAALSARFEALLARMGRPCPAGRPWHEHLTATGLDRVTARSFVQAYNRVRFGLATEGDALPLARLLAEAEQDLMGTKGVG